MPVDENTVRKICEKHGLGKFTRNQRLSGGIINPCFVLNDDFIIRFNVVDGTLPKLALEAQTIALLRSQCPSLPLPEIVAVDFDKEVASYEYSISKRIRGKPVREVWNGLDESNRKKIAEIAGQYLAQIHSIRVDYAGWQCLPTYTSSWRDYLSSCVQESAMQVVQLDGLTTAQADGLHQFAHTTASSIEIDDLTLLHGDYHFGNVLTDGQTVVGIIDLEWSHGGTPAYELAGMVDGLARCEGMAGPFTDGYKSIRPVPGISDGERLLYSIHTHLELLLACYRRGALWTEGEEWKHRALNFLRSLSLA